MSITKISPSVVDFDASITISTADNLDTLTLTSTDADASVGPTLALYRNSSSPADSDIIGSIDFDGRNDNSQDVQYSRIISQIVDASDGTEDATFYIQTIAGGTNQDRITIKSSETVFNEDSSDIDFRVESDGNSKALVILGDKYGLGVGRDPESAYNSYTSIELGQQGTLLANDAGDDFWFATNLYLDGSGTQKKKVTGVAGLFQIDGDIARFYTAASGSADTQNSWTARVRFDSDGIKFGSDSAAANALNDYEEGSFTIDTDGGDFSGGNHTAYYTKIGQLVNFYWYSGQSTIANSSGNATLTGLPFTSKGAGYTMFQFLHGTGVDGDSTGGYVNVSNTNAVFVDENAVTLSSYINGSSKYIMVQGQFVTDS